MRICNRLIIFILLGLLCNVALAQPSASLFRMINKEAREAKEECRYAEAENIYINGIKNQRISNVNRATLVLNYIDLCFIRGDYRTAENLLEIYTPQNEEQKQRWTVRKATVNYFLGYFDLAEKLYTEASENSSLDKASKYELLAFQGAMYMDQSQYDKALLYLNQALALSSDEQQSWNIRMEKTIPLAHIGQTNEALVLIDDCIKWFSNNGGKSSRSYQVCLRKKAEILMLIKKYKEASDAFRIYINSEKDYATHNFISKPEQWRLDFWKSIKPNISKVFALEDYCPEFLLDVSLFRREVAMLGNSDKEDMINRLNCSGSQIRKSLGKQELAMDFVRYQKNDTVWYGSIIIPSLSMKDNVQFIPLWTENELHSFELENGHKLVDALCSNSLGDKDVLYTDTCLTHFVWDKLNAVLESYDYDDIYFAPDGILHLFAIEYLREDNGVSLHRLTSLSNLIKKSNRRISNKSKMLAAGGFDYDTESCEPNENNSDSNHDAMDFLQKKLKHVEHPFTYLDGAKVEIDSISEITPFEITSANVKSEKQLKNDINNKEYNILHLSTHGYALDVEVPFIPEALRDSITEDKSLLASGIALTGANVAYKNQDQEDCIISAREFCEMDMSHIDLMVLSACQTGLGRFNDEGPAGLVRGLKKAGAGVLIVSLWNVSDEATMFFMKHLYKAMSEQSSIDIHAAFNTARLNFSLETKNVRRFNSKRMKTERYKETYNLPRFCNSFILIDAIK